MNQSPGVRSARMSVNIRFLLLTAVFIGLPAIALLTGAVWLAPVIIVALLVAVVIDGG